MSGESAGVPGRMCHVGENQPCGTAIGFTDARLLRFLGIVHGDDFRPAGATLHTSELLLRTALFHHRRLARRLVRMAGQHGEEVTDVVRDERAAAFPHWREGMTVHRVGTPAALALRLQLEASIGSVLFHARNVEEQLVLYTAKILKAPNAAAAPNGASRPPVRWDFFEDLRKELAPRVEVCAKGGGSDRKAESDLRKALGRRYLKEMDKDGDRSAKCEMGRIEHWRNKRAHEVVYHVTLEGDPWDVRYSASFNELMVGPDPAASFTGRELDAALAGLEHMMTWWREKVEQMLAPKKTPTPHPEETGR